MRFALLSLFAATVALAAPAGANPHSDIENVEIEPSEPYTCEYAHLSWEGGVPPYTIVVGDGEETHQRGSIGKELDRFEVQDQFAAYRIKHEGHLEFAIYDSNGRRTTSGATAIRSAFTECIGKDDGLPSHL